MSTTRCRIPLGHFYGHLIVLPEDVTTEQMQHVSVQNPSDLQNQMSILNMLFEDVSCRYSLSCSKLKELLHPFLMTDITNAAHLSAYMDIMKEKNFVLLGDHSKIFTAYQVHKYQHLSTVFSINSNLF